MGRSQGAFAGSIQAVSRRLDTRPQALADIAAAATWYEERQPGLGERFTREVVVAIDALLPNPLPMTFWAMNRNAIVLELGPAKAHALEQLASSVARRRDGNPLEPIPGDRCGCCMIATSYRYIVRRAGVRSGYPIVEGTRIGVHDVVGLIKSGAPVDDVGFACRRGVLPWPFCQLPSRRGPL